jgi:hypothetical protein
MTNQPSEFVRTLRRIAESTVAPTPPDINALSMPSSVRPRSIADKNPDMKTSKPTPRSVWVCGSKKISACRTPSAVARRK